MKAQENMSWFEMNWCREVMTQMLEKEIAIPLKSMPPPDSHEGKLYASSGKDPIDLSKVNEKLLNREYKTVIEWGLDVRKALNTWIAVFQTEDHPIADMACDLQEWFEKKFHKFPRNQNEQWLMELKKASELCQKLIDTAPPMALTVKSGTPATQ